MNVVMIISVINTVARNLSYYPIRSIYTSEERYKQTLKTIESVKKYIPDAYIVLIEGSVLNTEMETGFKNMVNMYINYSTDKDVYNAVNDVHKSYAEGVTILKFLESNEFKNLNVENLFKISGRYYLTDSFDINEYMNICNCFKPIAQGSYQYSNLERYHPVLYKIHKTSLDDYKNIFIKYSTQMFNVQVDMEAFLCQYMKNNVKLLDRLGVEGNIAVNGALFSK